jgi:hypothetical protein
MGNGNSTQNDQKLLNADGQQQLNNEQPIISSPAPDPNAKPTILQRVSNFFTFTRKNPNVPNNAQTGGKKRGKKGGKKGGKHKTMKKKH